MHNNAINSDPKSFATLRFLGPVMAGVINKNEEKSIRNNFVNPIKRVFK